MITLLASTPARAHNISISRGVLRVAPDALRAELTIPVDDLLHDYRPKSDREEITSAALDSLIGKYSEQVLRNFVIRDLAGERLTGRVRKTGHDLASAPAWPFDIARKGRVRYELEFPLTRRPSYLSLQQTFFSDGPSHAAQLTLLVTAADEESDTTVQLTNRGNVEPLEIVWPDDPDAMMRASDHGGDVTSAPSSAQIRVPNRFKAVRADLSIDDTEARLQIRMPLALLETWLTIDRRDHDVIRVEEQRAAQPALRKFFAGRNQFRADGQTITPEVVDVRMLGPERRRSGRVPPTDRLGTAWVRVEVDLRYPFKSAPQAVELTWDLFNGLVFEAEARVTAGGKQSRSTLTAYTPKFEWTRNSKP